jgi:hypothetical protein
MAIWLIALAYPLVNVADLALYAFQRMEVGSAAEMAVQSAFNACGQIYGTPIVTKCGPTLTTAINSGVQSTSLATRVTVSDKSECVDGTVTSGTQTTCPTNSGDYLAVTVAYTYRPLFHGASITSLLNTNLARTNWIRMS